MNADLILEELERDHSVAYGAKSLLQLLEEDIVLQHRKKTNGFKRIWIYLRHEVRLLLCTDNVKYKNERSLLKGSAAPVIALLSGTLVQQFGLSAGTAATFAAISLCVPLRLSINAWCSMTLDSEGLSAEELSELRNLADGKRTKRSKKDDKK